MFALRAQCGQRYRGFEFRVSSFELKTQELHSLKGNGGGDRTRTCKPLRAAVFKTAALPIMRPLRG
jgi:hypothetical protein